MQKEVEIKIYFYRNCVKVIKQEQKKTMLI